MSAVKGGLCLSSADKGEFFRCGRPHFLVQKTSDFSKFKVYPRTMVVESVWTFFGQGGANFLAILWVGFEQIPCKGTFIVSGLDKRKNVTEFTAKKYKNVHLG